MTAGVRLGLVVLAVVGVSGASKPSSGTVCDDDTLRDSRTHRVLLDGQGYDLLVHPAGEYVVAHSKGVLAIHPCTLEAEIRCRDRLGARRLRLRDDDRVEYARPDGTTRICNLASGRIAPAGAGGIPESTGHGVWVEDGRAFVRRASGRAQALRLIDRALSAASSADGSELVVGDRAGLVTLYGVTGLPRGRYRAHGRNAYAVAFDATNGRVVSVGGTGELALRRLPFRVEP